MTNFFSVNDACFIFIFIIFIIALVGAAGVVFRNALSKRKLYLARLNKSLRKLTEEEKYYLRPYINYYGLKYLSDNVHQMQNASLTRDSPDVQKCVYRLNKINIMIPYGLGTAINENEPINAKYVRTDKCALIIEINDQDLLTAAHEFWLTSDKKQHAAVLSKRRDPSKSTYFQFDLTYYFIVFAICFAGLFLFLAAAHLDIFRLQVLLVVLGGIICMYAVYSMMRDRPHIIKAQEVETVKGPLKLFPFGKADNADEIELRMLIGPGHMVNSLHNDFLIDSVDNDEPERVHTFSLIPVQEGRKKEYMLLAVDDNTNTLIDSVHDNRRILFLGGTLFYIILLTIALTTFDSGILQPEKLQAIVFRQLGIYQHYHKYNDALSVLKNPPEKGNYIDITGEGDLQCLVKKNIAGQWVPDCRHIVISADSSYGIAPMPCDKILDETEVQRLLFYKGRGIFCFQNKTTINNPDIFIQYMDSAMLYHKAFNSKECRNARSLLETSECVLSCDRYNAKAKACSDCIRNAVKAIVKQAGSRDITPKTGDIVIRLASRPSFFRPDRIDDSFFEKWLDATLIKSEYHISGLVSKDWTHDGVRFLELVSLEDKTIRDSMAAFYLITVSVVMMLLTWFSFFASCRKSVSDAEANNFEY